MNFKRLYQFLRKLQKNNNKTWMDNHRDEYHDVRDDLIEWFNQMDIKLAAVDPHYSPTTGKQAINRINNNLMYHPNKPIYKDHFGGGLDKEKKQSDFYMHFGVNETFVGGGFWHPSNKILKSIRAAIDYNGAEFKKILNKKNFKDTFGAMRAHDSLKTAPKGYAQDHEHIDLLRRKSFAVSHPFTQKETMASDFDDKVIAVYKEMLPFRRYLNQAVTV
ncbi:DUF2461 domain-containing protein [Marixanthomonas spongiae]|uniref:TIGR02453 family protein n=1 Tax=Marixanthomonas spongiae TaxID=2174845 RepID=A0A2U0HZ94_9FLAO|nr:DUF2461 domain-containing protein [Marixanthomonas spongiae]PVW14201.1 TIGR02453 family protein [Marixanthomonas spongiae]